MKKKKQLFRISFFFLELEIYKDEKTKKFNWKINSIETMFLSVLAEYTIEEKKNRQKLTYVEKST